MAAQVLDGENIVEIWTTKGIVIMEKASGDGEDWLNVGGHGTTTAGQLLGNMAHAPFKHPVYGSFLNMESYWQYIKTGIQHEALRSLNGMGAKKYANKYLKPVELPNFKELIIEGLHCKIEQNPTVKHALGTSELPLCHYFVYGNRIHDCNPKQTFWLIELARIRDALGML